ncbi:AidA/PixA family protein [Trinickia dabaoshanensis]|nr:AidA/PixA family protein [Trinickia dabaoshanensis]
MSTLARFYPEIIDVAVMVDAPRILYHYGPNKARDNVQFTDYVQLGPHGEGVGYVYMVSTWWDSQGEGGSEFRVFGNPGNRIRWRIQTLSMGGVADGVPADSHMAPAHQSGQTEQGTQLKPAVAYRPFIRGFVINAGAQNITPPKQVIETVNSWQIDPATEKIVRTQLTDVYWEAKVLQKGEVVYHMPFNIFCNCDKCADGDDGGDDGGHGGGGGGGDGCGGWKHDPFVN